MLAKKRGKERERQCGTTQSAASVVLYAICPGRDVVFSGAVSGSLVFFCDCVPADIGRFAILAYRSYISLEVLALKLSSAPFGLLLGLGLNDPWV